MDWSALADELFEEARADETPAVELPVLPQAALDFLELSKQPGAAAADLAAVIETDSGLTGHLLRYLNSGAFSLRSPVESVSRAIKLLGMRPCRVFLTAVAVQSAASRFKSSLFHPATFAGINLQRAVFAREVAGRLGLDASLSFAAALMQDVLLPAIAEQELAAYIEMLGSRRDDPLNERERDRFRWDHAAATGRLLRDWKLPDDLVCCVTLHHDLSRIRARPEWAGSELLPVALSALLPDAYKQSPGGVEVLLGLDASWPGLRLEALMEEVDAHCESMGGGGRRQPLAPRFAAAAERRALTLTSA